MAKTKLHRLHKIKVHPNRWLIWSIAYAVIVAIAMWGYINVSDINFDQQFNAENSYQSSHAYNDNNLGFGLKYPAGWSIEAGGSSVSFVPSDSAEEGVTVTRMALGAEKSIRSASKIIREKTITVDGITAVKYTDNLGNGALESVVLIKYSGNLYVIRGSSKLVDQILLTFRFLN